MNRAHAVVGFLALAALLAIAGIILFFVLVNALDRTISNRPNEADAF